MLRQFAVEQSIRPAARCPRSALPGLLPGLFIALLLASFWPAEAQDDTSPPPRRNRDTLGVPDMRVPTVDRKTGDIVDPQMEEILVQWSEHTKGIKTIEGRHMRAIFDWQFNTETRAEGQYYVEMPDKGRIDIEKYKDDRRKPGSIDVQKDPSGKKHSLTMEEFNQPERWVCNGKDLKVINDTKKTYDVFPIPENRRGTNMMDGPLPFLFGMPPEKAKARYHFTLIEPGRDPNNWWIEVRPKMRDDAAEWRRAFLVLNNKTYLPREVDLFDTGSKQTVYLFWPPTINKTSLLPAFMAGDPFNPSLTWYRREVHSGGNVAPGGEGVVPAGGIQMAERLKMPFFLDAPGEEARQRGDELRRQGFRVEYHKGPPAQRRGQEYRIADQSPPPMTPLRPGDRIVLIYYDKMQQMRAKPPVEQTAKPTIDPPTVQ
jgi:TIGR03009 family protein